MGARQVKQAKGLFRREWVVRVCVLRSCRGEGLASCGQTGCRVTLSPCRIPRKLKRKCTLPEQNALPKYCIHAPPRSSGFGSQIKYGYQKGRKKYLYNKVHFSGVPIFHPNKSLGDGHYLGGVFIRVNPTRPMVISRRDFEVKRTSPRPVAI